MSDRLQPVPGTQASRLPNLVGQTIGDDIEQFKLQKVIGRGSWGIVYLAHSLLHVGKNYAVKCIAHGDDVPDIIRETSAKELENHFHCQLYIPGVLKIHTLLQDDDRGVLFIVSEYCPDGDLLDLVLNKTFVGKDALIRSAFCQILDTVEAMHDLGVYHRDLKPDNIMCKDGGQTFVLGDFGFATEDETMTEFGMGSEPFMSPGMYLISLIYIDSNATVSNLRGLRGIIRRAHILQRQTRRHLGARRYPHESRLRMSALEEGRQRGSGFLQLSLPRLELLLQQLPYLLRTQRYIEIDIHHSRGGPCINQEYPEKHSGREDLLRLLGL